MLGGWIAFDKALPDKPEIRLIADVCGVSKDAAIVACLRFWSWADDHARGGLIPWVKRAEVDANGRLEHLAKALEKCGWIRVTKRGVALVNFTHWNRETAKDRMRKSGDGKDLGGGKSSEKVRKTSGKLPENGRKKSGGNSPLQYSTVTHSKKEGERPARRRARTGTETETETGTGTPPGLESDPSPPSAARPDGGPPPVPFWRYLAADSGRVASEGLEWVTAERVDGVWPDYCVFYFGDGAMEPRNLYEYQVTALVELYQRRHGTIDQPEWVRSEAMRAICTLNQPFGKVFEAFAKAPVGSHAKEIVGGMGAARTAPRQIPNVPPSALEHKPPPVPTAEELEAMRAAKAAGMAMVRKTIGFGQHRVE